MNGDKLRMLRKESGLLQEELGAKIGLDGSTISKYERGFNEPEDAIKADIAKLFGVSVDYLLDLTDSRKPDWSSDYYVRLPANLPEAARDELHTYIGFLEYKYRRPENNDI